MYLVGKQLVIMGTWESAPVPEGGIPIYVNPIVHSTDEGELVFGYTDLTTQAILAKLESEVVPGETVFLDVGAGSGIVAIAAKLLGAKEVITTEKNPRAIKVAKENIRVNEVNVDFRNTDRIPNDLPELDLVSVNFGSWSSGKNLKAQSIVDQLPLKGKGKVLVTIGVAEDIDGRWEVEDRFTLEAPVKMLSRVNFASSDRYNSIVSDRTDLVVIRRK